MRLIINFDIVYCINKSQIIIKYSDSDYASDKQNQKLILKHVYMLEDKLVS